MYGISIFNLEDTYVLVIFDPIIGTVKLLGYFIHAKEISIPDHRSSPMARILFWLLCTYSPPYAQTISTEVAKIILAYVDPPVHESTAFSIGLYFIYVDYLILDLFKLLYVYICHFPTSFSLIFYSAATCVQLDGL